MLSAGWVALLIFRGSQAFQQPAFPPGRVVFVDDAFLGSFIERFDRQGALIARLFEITGGHGHLRLFDEGAGFTPIDSVPLSSFFVLPHPFGGGSEVRQEISSGCI